MTGNAKKKKFFEEDSVNQSRGEENTFSKVDSPNEKSVVEEIFSEDKSVSKSSTSKEISISVTHMETTRFIDLTEDNTAQIQLNKASEGPAALTVLVGPEDLIGVSWPIEKAVTTVGRSASLSDIHIAHTGISRSHFQLLQEEDRIFVMDLKSTNKTFLNNRELKSYEKELLRNNDQIRSGNVIFKFFEQGQLEILSTAMMRDKAQTDPLTGLANRRALNARGPEFFRKSKSLCLILFDVDKFKDINDTYGHLAGDSVLKQFSSLVMTLVREGDMLFRYGGDEFCLFTRTPAHIAKNISERICHTVEKHEFIYEGKQLPVTISVGAAARTSKDKKWEDVYKRADEASYEAKQAGRNQARFK